MDTTIDARLEHLRDHLLGGATLPPDAVRAILDLALLMACADGDASEREAEHVVAVLRRVSDVPIDLSAVKIELGGIRAVIDAGGAEAKLRSAASDLTDPVMRRHVYRIVATVALVDGWLDKNEIRLFNQLARVLDIPPLESTQLVSEVRRALFPEEAS